MKVAVVGTGYVGLVSGACLAEMGHEVTCIDTDQAKIKELHQGKCPIYKQGLDTLLARNRKAGRLHFSVNFDSISRAKFIFVAVGTPSTDSGRPNLKYLMEAVKMLASKINEGAIIVMKSTVPIGTSLKVKEWVRKWTSKNFYLVSNPEFLQGGASIEDFMKPDRIVIGHQEDYGADQLIELYASLRDQGYPIYKMSHASAEMAKYAANCFLATKISFINDMAKLCHIMGADIEEVRSAMISDPRISKDFLNPGIGYGGSCFPKDIKALLKMAKEMGTSLRIIQATQEINEEQKVLMFERLRSHFGDMSGKIIAFWGVAFKPHTDDIRETPAIFLAQKVMEAGGKVQFYDPVASANFLRCMGESEKRLQSFSNMYGCLEDADALVLVTEWPEFHNPDWGRIKELLNSPVIFDGRNIYSTSKVLAAGLYYYGVGKYIPKL